MDFEEFERKYAVAWKKWEAENAERLHRHLDSEILSILRSFVIEEPFRLGDFGYGKGRLLEKLRTDFPSSSFYGFEPNRYLRDESGSNFQHISDAEAFMSLLPELDVILCTSVVHLLADSTVRRMMEQLHMLPDLRFIISVPHPAIFESLYYNQGRKRIIDSSWDGATEVTYYRTEEEYQELIAGVLPATHRITRDSAGDPMYLLFHSL